MLTFAPNSDVTLTFDMFTADGDVIDPVSATYRVFDDEGAEVVSSTAVAVSGGEEEISVTIAAVNNAIGGAANGARTVLLSVITAAGAYELSQTYVLETHGFLSVPSESVLTLPQSLMLARQLAQSVLDIWDDAEDHERQAALREAWIRIDRFPFTPWRSYETIPDSASDTLKTGAYRVSELSSADWALLPEHFKSALKRAQLVEAAVLLDGDPTWDRRQDGLISKTVGESSEMFTSHKASVTTISPKSYREIKGYVRRKVSLARA